MAKKEFVVLILCLMIFSVISTGLAQDNLGDVKEVDIVNTDGTIDVKNESLLNTNLVDSTREDVAVIEQVKEVTYDDKPEEIIITPSAGVRLIERKIVVPVKPAIEPVVIAMPPKQLQLVAEAPLSERAATIRELKADDFRSYQREMLMHAIEKCTELEKDAELCEKKLRERLELVKRLQDQDIERVQKISEKKAEAVNDVDQLGKAEAFENYDKEKEFKVRILAQAEVQEAKQKFEQAKVKIEETKQKFDEAKDNLEELQKEEALCKGKNCEEVESEQKLEAREMLIHAAENVLKSLEQTFFKIEEAEFVTDGEALQYVGLLNDEMDKISGLKGRVEIFTEDTPKEEINAAFKELRKAVVDGKLAIRRTAGHLVSARIGAIIVKAKHLEIKLNSVLERMAEKGKAVAEIEPLIVRFNSKLAEARANYEKARDELAKFEGDSSTLDYPEQHIDRAKQDVIDAQKVLQDILTQISLNDGEDELAETEVVTRAIESVAEVEEVS